MTWLRLDDSFAQHPKVIQLARAERWTWVELLSYCARYKTDGSVPRSIREVVPYATPKLIKKLVDLCLLDEDEQGWKVHDWEEYNPSDPTAAERSRRYRNRDADRDATVTPTVTDAVTDSVTRHGSATDKTVTRTAPRARASAPVAPSPSPEEISTAKAVSSNSEELATMRSVLTVANTTLGHKWKLTEDRKRVIRARLREGYTEEQLIDAIRGVAADPWEGRCMSGNDDLVKTMRSAAQVDKFLDLSNGRNGNGHATIGQPGFKPRSAAEQAEHQRLLRATA